MPGVRDENALEAALSRPQQRWHYEPRADLAAFAGSYAFGLSKAHPFNDGNKRTAFLAAVVSLGLNGKELDATETDVAQAMTAFAAGSLSEVALADWIRTRPATVAASTRCASRRCGRRRPAL